MGDEGRIDWLDTAKAVGMVLVYIGHCNIPGVNPYIYLFHMPLFFLISGFCWNTEKNRQLCFAPFFTKKFRSYIIPYLKVSLICLLLIQIPHNFAAFGLSNGFIESIYKYLFGIFIYSRGTIEWLPMCSPLWFLTCLFSAEIVFYFIMKQSSHQKFCIVVCMGIIGYLMSLVGKVFPYNIDTAMTSIPFLYAGMLLRKHDAICLNVKNLYLLIPISIIVLVWGVKGVDFDGNSYDNIAMMYIESCVICVTILIIIKATGGGVFFFIRKKLVIIDGL